MSDIYVCNIDITTALDWQRSNADIPKAFILNEQEWLNENHCKFWNYWTKDVFTLGTANDFGLSVWSIILDEPIYGYSLPSLDDYPDFGFSTTSENFSDGSFAVDNEYTYEFTTEQKRILLQLKSFQVLSINGSVNQINQSMSNIFGENVIFALDRLDMSFVYILNDLTIIDFVREIKSRDLFPRPIGIDIDEIRILNTDTFGFSEADQNFFDGNFFDGSI